MQFFFDLMLFVVLNLEMKLLETSVSKRTITYDTEVFGILSDQYIPVYELPPGHRA